MRTTPVIAIHGGAGTISAAALDAGAAQAYHEALRAIVQAGQALLLRGGSALDAVCLAVEMLEDCPLFNAGHGAVFTHAEHARARRGRDERRRPARRRGRLRQPHPPPGARRARGDGGRRPRAAGRRRRRGLRARARAGDGRPVLLLHRGAPRAAGARAGRRPRRARPRRRGAMPPRRWTKAASSAPSAPSRSTCRATWRPPPPPAA